ncbi:DUF2062 domain-containing protein [Salipiger marinus]|uniref:DUF2062 domain-containing protein n=1 Tax=Salipiger marinus TaxID=555512 RepID=A0A1G8I3N1_9RHOB|nr:MULTISPECIES: DUF2062 domain-containing protein [Salipiger]HBM61861.1 DUF2062 domain-containing protein [Citreicella sp.]MCD1617105.1 DUF2062 domain-containing protein [Salipiger manganoxidans]MEB3417153.1 DUF2062 domain-containing protein [Salipiger manganoxidans]SDI13539.1 hypothetical protein SAMN04487993_1001204 [Salipiger marinus]HBT00499.1 DUF2062 domain-containing protein [Citreicella sp.]
MVFKRRDRRPVWKIVLQFFWPRGGWGRAARYIQHRLHRLPDSPEKIARGIFAGVFTTFTPFYGLHFIVAATLAFLVRGNILAALLGTFFGNPLTYVPIGIVALETGNFLLGIDRRSPHHGSLLQKFGDAGQGLWDNLCAMIAGEPVHWDRLLTFYHEVFYPYLIGGILPGIVAGLVCYYLSVPVIRAYQNRRKGALKNKLAALKNRKKQADGDGGAD